MFSFLKWMPVALVVLWGPWTYGGGRSPLQDLLPWLSALLLLPWVLPESNTSSWREFRRDPAVIAGAVLLLLISIQHLNSPRTLVFIPETLTWRLTAPPWPYFPSAVRSWESREYLNWFLPSVFLCWTLRHVKWSRNERRRLIAAILLGAGLLSMAGFTELFIQRTTFIGKRFAGFGYPNHAAQFFLLAQALLWSRTLAALHRPPDHRAVWGVYLVAHILFSLSIIATLSRAGVAALALLHLAGVYFCWQVLQPTSRSRSPGRPWFVSATILIALAIGGGVLWSSDNPRLARELDGLTPQRVVGDLAGGGRLAQIEACMGMWREAPLFGWGAWGYRHLLTQHMKVDQIDEMDQGAANAHCDYAQFLAELGVVGFGALIVLFGAMLRRLATRVRARDPTAWVVAIGCGILLLWAWIDLPFRNVSNLCMWVLVAGSVTMVRPKT